MNVADNQAGNKAIDSLINYETVKVMFIALDKRVYHVVLSYFSMKTYVVVTHLKCLNEAPLASTHNISVRGKI